MKKEPAFDLNRRQILLAGIAYSALPAQIREAPALLDRGFAKVTQLAPGVYATIADPSKGPQCTSNGGVIAGRDGVLIVEGHMQPEGAALEIEVARMVSRAPIRGAVNTHFHYDHTFGNAGYAREKIPIIAHEKVGPAMREQYATRKGADRAGWLAPLERKIAQTADEADKKRQAEDLEFTKRMYDAIDAATLAYPTEALSSAQLPLRIDLGGLTALLELHPGHTPGDIVIRIPEHDILFAGDLLFHRSFPVAVDADMIGWRKVLSTLTGHTRAARFIPGHGPVCGQETVADQCAVFDDLRAHAERMLRAGASAEEAERRYAIPERFKDYRIFGWGFRVGAAMRSYYTVLRGNR